MKFRGLIALGLTFLVLWPLSALAKVDRQVTITNFPELERIQKRGKLIVAITEPMRPPFYMRNKKNELFGLDIEIAQDIARRMGVTVEFDQTAKTFDQVINQVNQRKADIGIANLTKTINRGKKVQFTNTYLLLKVYFLLNRLVEHDLGKDPDLRKLINRRDIRIGVLAGSAYSEQAAHAFPQAQLINSYTSERNIIADILDKKLHIALIDETPIKNWFYEQPGSSLYLHSISYPEMSDPIAMAVHYEDQNLLAWLNLYIELSHLDGSRETIRRKYLENASWRNELP